MARQSEGRPRGADVRTTSYRPEPPRSTYTSRGERVVPQYEERRPDFAADSYFDAQPRATSRKESDYAERAPPRRATESKEKPRGFMRSSKDSDKEKRKEKSRQTEREVRKERERKRDPYVEEDSESEDDYARRARRMREEDAIRRAREQYHEPSPKAQRDVPDVSYDSNSRLKQQTADAWDYIRSSRGGAPQPRHEERRPSPVRMESTKDRVQSIKVDHGARPGGLFRRGSVRPTSKESKDEKKREKETPRKASSRTPERRSSAENVDERRPPPLNTSKSSPADIHIPSEKQRATSLQPDSVAMPPPPPQVRRSETMPHSSSARRSENVPPKSSRATEFKEGQPTPATTPDNQAPPPHKFPYSNRAYADDAEYATPEGYRTSAPQERARPSFTRRVTRSPSPIKEPTRELPREYAPRPSRDYESVPRSRDFTPREMPRSRENRESPQPMQDEPYRDLREARDPRDARQPAYRTSSARYADRPQPMPARTTSYVYTPAGVEPVSRMSPVREPSSRDAPSLYGEIPTSRSPHQRPVDDEVRYAKPMRAPSVRMQSGYGYARPNGERPQISRNNSGGYRSARAVA